MDTKLNQHTNSEKLLRELEAARNEKEAIVREYENNILLFREQEKALKESTEQLTMVVGNIKEVVFVTDIQGLWIYLNKSWTEVTGYSVEESLGTLFLNYVHPDDRDRNNQLFLPLIERKKDYCRHEVRYLTKEGGYRWVEVYARLGIDENGEVNGTYGTLLDITERRKTQEFENVLLQLSSKLTGIPLSEYQTAINHSLQQIGSYLETDRSYIFELDKVSDTMTNTYEWCNEGIEPAIEELQDIPCAIFPQWMKSLHKRENILIPLVSELPASWQAEREILEPQGIQSLIVIPLLSDNELIGFVGLDSVRQKREYTQAEVNTLKVWGSMLSGLIKHKRSEIQLERQQHNFRSFFNTIDEFLWVLDEDGQIVYANETVYERLGYTHQELNGQHILMVHPTERRAEVARTLDEMIKGTKDFCPVPLVTRSGTQIPVETRIKKGIWNDQEVIYGITKDLSKIRLSEEKFSKAFQTNSSLMAISRFEDGCYIDVNETFLRKMGVTREETIGKSPDQLGFLPFSNAQSRLNRLIEKDIPVRDLELEVCTRGGKTITGLFSAEPLYIGMERCLLTVMMDITDRKRNEEAIRKATEEAEKANLAKSEFLSRVSHELRTPLNSILGFGQLLELAPLTAGQHKSVDHILKSGKYLLELINEVLDISSIETGKIHLNPEPLQVASIVQELADNLYNQAKSRNIRIHTEQLDKDLYVQADQQRFRQIVLNLMNNAIKYNIEGGYIDVRAEKSFNTILQKNTVRVWISDNGTGIAASDLPNLFNPFERAGAQHTQTEGTGLGLAVVKQLSEAMGGQCGVESTLGEGSTFWVELPEACKTACKVLTPDAETEKNTEKNNSATVLYIEDNVPNIELVEMILNTQRPEIKLTTVMNGKKAVSLAVKCRADLILLDLNLPGMSGEEILTELKATAETRNIPVVVISADVMPKRKEDLLKAGAEFFLTKPLIMKDFLDIVDRFTI